MLHRIVKITGIKLLFVFSDIISKDDIPPRSLKTEANQPDSGEKLGNSLFVK